MASLWPRSSGLRQSNGRARPAVPGTKFCGSLPILMPPLKSFGSTWNEAAPGYPHAAMVFQDDPQLSRTAKSLIEDPGNRKLVSIASCWEIAIKAGIGKMSLSEPSRTLLEREIPRNNFELLGITLEHATTIEHLPQHHKDPFDRLL